MYLFIYIYSKAKMPFMNHYNVHSKMNCKCVCVKKDAILIISWNIFGNVITFCSIFSHVKMPTDLPKPPSPLSESANACVSYIFPGVSQTQTAGVPQPRVPGSGCTTICSAFIYTNIFNDFWHRSPRRVVACPPRPPPTPVVIYSTH